MRYTLMTIDVWDTLLRRHGHEDSSKLASAYHLSLAYHHQLRPDFCDYRDIFDERCSIEAHIAQDRLTHSGDGEYTIDEVLTILCQRILLPGSSPASVAGIAGRFELDYEIRHTYADPTIVRTLAQYQAVQRYFLSDFYMPAHSLQALLAHHQLDKLIDGGFSSCDSGLNKRRGNLYPFIHNTLGVPANEHLHIGDNPDADIAMARQHGIDTLHYLPEEQHAQRQQKQRFINDRQALFTHIAHTIDTAAASTLANLSPEAQSAFRLGMQSAPLYAGFMLHIAEEASIEQLDAVYFFTREGEFFIQVWQQLFPDSQLQGIALPAASTLAVSRIATFAASLREVSTQEMMRLWNQYATQSISALCKTLGIGVDVMAPLCAHHQIDIDEQIVYPWTSHPVQALFADPAFIDVLSARIAHSRHALLAYLADNGLTAQRRIGIVDIGWRGTIQDNLAHVLPDIKLHGFYLGLQTYLNKQPANCTKSAYGPDDNHATQHSPLLQAVSMLEMLSNSPFGSVTGFHQDAHGTYRPERLVDAEENAVYHRFTQYFQQGVLAASQVWATYIDRYVVSSHELRPPALRVWEALLRTPDHALASAHTALHHNEIFGVGGFVQQDPPPAYTDVLLGIISGNRRRKVIRFIKQTHWPSGLWIRKDLSFHRKAFLVSLCYIAMMYQRLRIRIKHSFL